MVAATITLNFFFGSGLMVPGTGILLNNQMDDFSVKPGVPNGFQLIGADANAIAPKKRPLSSSTPTFVEGPNGLMIIGSPGGSYIPGMVILGTLDFLDGKNAQDIVSAPRFHHQFSPDVLQFESDAFTPEERKALEARGHTLREGTRKWGNEQVVTWDYKTRQGRGGFGPARRGRRPGVLEQQAAAKPVTSCGARAPCARASRFSSRGVPFPSRFVFFSILMRVWRRRG